MAVPFDTPVSAIEGVGPAAERLFQLQGVFTVYDLLRASSPALHGAVSSLASAEEVQQLASDGRASGGRDDDAAVGGSAGQRAVSRRSLSCGASTSLS